MALLTCGMVVGRITGRPLLRSGLRQLALTGWLQWQGQRRGGR